MGSVGAVDTLGRQFFFRAPPSLCVLDALVVVHEGRAREALVEALGDGEALLLFCDPPVEHRRVRLRDVVVLARERDALRMTNATLSRYQEAVRVAMTIGSV